jgi:hypothetical protein
MEPRVLLSRDLVESARQRLHLAFPTHAAAAPGRIVSPDTAHPGHAAHAGPVPSATAYTLPGTAGQSVEATFTLTERQAWSHNEVGLFLVDDPTCRIGALRPGDHGYAAAALGRRQGLFTPDQQAGAVTLLLPGGSSLGTYLIQNSSFDRFLARNRHDRLARQPMAFFFPSRSRPPTRTISSTCIIRRRRPGPGRT